MATALVAQVGMSWRIPSIRQLEHWSTDGIPAMSTAIERLIILTIIYFELTKRKYFSLQSMH
ncbi:hypothetical protein TU81_06530 [Pseudomonas lini]|nr:hypothetical protein TU81_06530 [Pseudomonas lini]